MLVRWLANRSFRFNLSATTLLALLALLLFAVGIVLLAYLNAGAPDITAILSGLEHADAAAAVLSDEPVSGDVRAIAEDCVKQLARRALEAEMDRLGRLLETADGTEKVEALERLRETGNKLKRYK